VDIHSSRSVLEHVPPVELKRILAEARQVLKPGGRLVHLVDPSDHFSAVDDGITTIHFLRFSEREWAGYAGNQFAYHNRLRSDDFEALFREESLDLLEADYVTDPRALADLQAGFPLDARFRGRDPERLAQSRALYVLSPR
jgi:SAM-dependent methyltransferase